MRQSKTRCMKDVLCHLCVCIVFVDFIVATCRCGTASIVIRHTLFIGDHCFPVTTKRESRQTWTLICVTENLMFTSLVSSTAMFRADMKMFLKLKLDTVMSTLSQFTSVGTGSITRKIRDSWNIIQNWGLSQRVIVVCHELFLETHNVGVIPVQRSLPIL